MKNRRVIYYIRLHESELRVFSSPHDKWEKLPSHYNNRTVRRFPLLLVMEDPEIYSKTIKVIYPRLNRAERIGHDIKGL